MTSRLPNCFQRTAGRCEAVTDASGIPSEPRTERKVGCAGFRPITRIRVPLNKRNESGTAEVYCAFVS